MITAHLFKDPDALLCPALVVVQDEPRPGRLRLWQLGLRLRPQSRRQRLADAARHILTREFVDLGLDEARKNVILGKVRSRQINNEVFFILF